MKKTIIKTLIFMAVWILSFTTAIYLYSALFMGHELSGIDIVLNICGFALSMLWLWNNIVKGLGND